MSDTDILVILLGNMNFINKKIENLEAYMGVVNSQKYINISKLYEKLGKKLCQALPDSMHSRVLILILNIPEKEKTHHSIF